MRSAIPDAEITWVVNDALCDVVRLCPGISRIIPFPRKNLLSLSKISAFARELRKESYDVAIDFQGLLRSGVMTMLCRAGKKVGFSSAREGATMFYGSAFHIPDMHTHAVDKNIQLARFALDIPSEIPVPPPSVSIPQESNAAMDEIAPPAANSPILAVCFSSRWHSKNWSPQFISESIDCASEQVPGLRVFLTGSKDDKELGDRIAALCRDPHPVNLAGKTDIAGLAALLSRSSAMFTVDSGPMHLAAAIGIPCVAMFGSTDDVLTGPYGPAGLHTVIHTKCRRAPCFRHECPLARNCADGCSPQEAASAIRSATCWLLPVAEK